MATPSSSADQATTTNNNEDIKNEKRESTEKTPKVKYITRKQANALIIDAGEAVKMALKELEPARELAERAGLSVDSRILGWNKDGSIAGGGSGGGGPGNTASGAAGFSSFSDPSMRTQILARNNSTSTGGHSNTDHVVIQTGNARTDRIAELKRNLLRRARSMQPENRGEDRWDKPRIPGERRRRIIREKDLPEAPPEPPPSGYVVFVGQMTTKIRHDRPNVQHDQSKVVKEISKIWRLGMSEEDRQYYNEFAIAARNEYQKQHIEYRATGNFTPSKEFHKLNDVNVWVRAAWHEKNLIEREISEYDTCLFPKRPAEMDELYERKVIASKKRRQLKLKGLLNEDGTVKEGVGVEFNEDGTLKECPQEDGEESINENGDDEGDSDSTGNNDDMGQNSDENYVWTKVLDDGGNNDNKKKLEINERKEDKQQTGPAQLVSI